MPSIMNLSPTPGRSGGLSASRVPRRAEVYRDMVCNLPPPTIRFQRASAASLSRLQPWQPAQVRSWARRRPSTSPKVKIHITHYLEQIFWISTNHADLCVRIQNHAASSCKSSKRGMTRGPNQASYGFPENRFSEVTNLFSKAMKMTP